MLKKLLKSQFLVTNVWLLIISSLWLLRGHSPADLPLLWFGAWLGTFLLDLDHLLYVFIYPEELTSLRVKYEFKHRNLKDALTLLTDTAGERKKLAFHHALFQLIFLFFCFFVLTSTESLFGAGLVMAIALGLLSDEIRFLSRGQGKGLRTWLWWPIGRKVSLKEQEAFVILMVLIFLGLNLFLV